MNILDSLDQLDVYFEKIQEKQFRKNQIIDWIFKKYATTFEEMTNISFVLKDKLKKAFFLSSMKLVKIEESENKQTKKFLFQFDDGHFIESVLILSNNRKTVCVSSQVGCPIRCTFCASGKKGFFRNLKVSEILLQILYICNFTKQDITHVVFMGMGEPLLNFDAVIKSIKIISDEKYFKISQRRITLSTVGIVENIYRLAQEDLKINLVLSLHAPNDEIRKKIIPHSKNYPLKNIFKALDEYFNITKRDIAYEYILIEEINDNLDHAQKLVDLLEDKQCSVNLIPYNEIDSLSYKKPSSKRVDAFKNFLKRKKIITTQRYTKGDDIAAACGQLAVKN